MTAHSHRPSRAAASGDSAKAPASASGQAPAFPVDTQKAISTEALFGSKREVLISHEGTLYRLRITSKDKLILTK